MRPLLTFALVAFNQERFIAEAVEGALLQSYTPLEIILSDDCSSDRTFEIIKNIARKYQGGHRIIINRNDYNVGLCGHINKIMKLSNGEFIIIAAGDDISFSDRVEKIYMAYQSSNYKAKSIFSNYINIDENSKETIFKYDRKIDGDCFYAHNIVYNDLAVTGCTHSWHKDVFKIFGDIITPLTCEDRVIAFRSGLVGQIKYIQDALVKVRRHDSNIWLYDQDTNKRERVEDIIKKQVEFRNFWTLELKGIYNNWLKDLEVSKKLFVDRKKEMEELEIFIKKELAMVHVDVDLYNSKYLERIKIILKTITQGVEIRKTRHRIGIFLFPWLYKKYMGFKYRVSLHLKYIFWFLV